MPKILLNNRVRLHYVRVGDGPDLVMIHGLSGNLAVWHLKMAPILQEHFRVLTYDLRGHGYSDVPPSGYTTADMAEDLTQLLDALGFLRSAPGLGPSTAQLLGLFVLRLCLLFLLSRCDCNGGGHRLLLCRARHGLHSGLGMDDHVPPDSP